MTLFIAIENMEQVIISRLIQAAAPNFVDLDCMLNGNNHRGYNILYMTTEFASKEKNYQVLRHLIAQGRFSHGSSIARLIILVGGNTHGT